MDATTKHGMPKEEPLGERIDRRKFLKLAGGVTAGVALSVCAAPPPTPTPAAVATPSPTVPPAEPITIAVPSLREQTFLTSSGALARKVYFGVMFDYLVHIDPDTWELKPGLALRWDFSADKKQVTFLLRGGVKWHGGRGEVTSEDVKFTIESVIKPESRNARAGFFRSLIERIEAPEPYRVVLNLKRPHAALLVELSPFGAIHIVPKQYVQSVGEAAFESAPIGSGPYEFAGMEPGQNIKYRALRQHWRVKPHFPALEFKAVPEEVTRVSMLQTGAIHVAPVSAPAAARLTTDLTLQIKSVSQSYGVMVWFGGMLHPRDKRFKREIHRKDPWNDIRVREAMNIAVDRNTIVKQIYAGKAQPNMTGWMFPGWDVLPAYPYDPARAKALLAEAGFANGFDLKVMSYPLSPGAELPVVMGALAQYWQAVGIRTRVVPTEFAVFRAAWGRGETQGVVYPLRMPNQWDWEAESAMFLSANGTLPSFGHDELEDTFRSLAGELDRANRNRSFGQLNAILRREIGAIGVANVDDIHVLSKKIRSWTPLRGAHPIYWEYLT